MSDARRLKIAEAVHHGRYPGGRAPKPFAALRGSPRQYCLRIADAVIATVDQLG